MREALRGGFGGFLCQVGIEKPYLTSCEAACVYEEVAKADSECPLYLAFLGQAKEVFLSLKAIGICENDGNTQVFYLKNAVATFSSFVGEQEIVEF